MTTTILIIVNVFTALAIIGLTLMQQSKGDMGSAFGGGSSQSMFGSRGSANFLSRTTSIMCVLFFVSSLALAYVYAQRADSSSVIDSSVIENTEPEIIEIPADGSVPSIPGIENIPDEVEASPVPSIPDAVNQAEDAVPSVPEAVDVIEEAVEQIEDTVPAVPE